MSKKNLLNESTVRQFMKYANIGALAENFVTETYGDEEVVEEGDYMEDEEGMEDMGDDMPVDDMAADDMAADDVAVDDVEADDMAADECLKASI